jgi:hypothetical protein
MTHTLSASDTTGTILYLSLNPISKESMNQHTTGKEISNYDNDQYQDG